MVYLLLLVSLALFATVMLITWQSGAPNPSPGSGRRGNDRQTAPARITPGKGGPAAPERPVTPGEGEPEGYNPPFPGITIALIIPPTAPPAEKGWFPGPFRRRL
ncbi:hypothetical protein GFC01_04730 [Desulfofundulus thermobenzoicus]|uniref:Uncharacterized protein n=1 Tax=Desulfofundulus thermobenzoicus TaxID=29376 RepID=A0A6N7INJ2_9FIRM|nr:hypothetical protein [Desulfofundulus thermobenzoicus]MQL51576.1 hypothetical protein [Desulfofundulus thermobenzoicus]